MQRRIRTLGKAAAASAIYALVPSIAWAACPAGTVTQYCFPDPFNGASVPTIISYIISALLSLVAVRQS